MSCPHVATERLAVNRRAVCIPLNLRDKKPNATPCDLGLGTQSALASPDDQWPPCGSPYDEFDN